MTQRIFPLDPKEFKDNDKDGIGDNGDEDDDNDGSDFLDEKIYGTDPLNQILMVMDSPMVREKCFGNRSHRSRH